MCCGCWDEEGSPKIWNERVERGLKSVEALYASPHGGVGGRMHIVTDDFNIGDDNIEFCDNEINGTGGYDHGYPPTDEERECVAAFKAMSFDERASCLGLHDGCWRRG